MGYPGVEVACYLGETTSAVNSLALSQEFPDLENIVSCFNTYVPSSRKGFHHGTAVYGPVCTVVWEGRSREASPYPDWA